MDPLADIEDELDQAAEETLTHRNAYLFMIDASPCMFDVVLKKGAAKSNASQRAEPREVIPMQEMLTLALETMKTKAVLSPQDWVGVAFYNTEKANVKDFKHIFVHLPLRAITKEACVSLSELIQTGTEHGQEGALALKKEITERMGSTTDLSSSAIFWAATDLFADIKGKQINKTLLLCTNQDDPHHGHLTKDHAARVRLNDFIENNGAVVVVTEDAAAKKFDASLFWSRILGSASTAASYGGYDITTVKKMRKSLEGITCRRLTSRSLAQGLVLDFGNVSDNSNSNQKGSDTTEDAASLFCGVRIFSAFVRSKLARTGLIDGVTNDEVKAHARNRIDTPTSSTDPAIANKEDNQYEDVQITGKAEEEGDVEGKEVVSYFSYGGEKMVATSSELAALRSNASPAIKLLYTLPASELSMLCHIRSSTFLYPDERVYLGSTTLFCAFLKSMLSKNRIAVCTYQLRRPGDIRLCMLCPEGEVLEDDGDSQVQPPGFRLIPLPFANDIRADVPPPAYQDDTLLSKDGEPTENAIQNDTALKTLIAPFVRDAGETYDPEENANIVNQAQHHFITAKALGEPTDMALFQQRDAQQTDPKLFARVAQMYYKGRTPDLTLEQIEEKVLSTYGPFTGVAASGTIATAARKRVRTDENPHDDGVGNGEGPQAKVKKGQTKDDASGIALQAEALVRQKFAHGQLGQCTVGLLRDFLSAVAPSKRPNVRSMKKADLVNEVTRLLSKEG